ncbi:cation:proton antiporter [Pengzhenrongella frigida]|uniref:Cation:proton antiporter n=1 Tax=Pengzhenrongella frigida TaxID=1259133 RepID=A0A4Q5N080_9MICO|nr:cation:proton antiporter [Cellulomonas sp. HLT2-17]RYV51416.1 cation:proton antiporter [Cellulomonas sp. HLT2-17]
MTFGTLAVVALIGVLGPALAWPQRWHVPVVVGELFAGILVGPMVLDWLDAGDVTLTFLADIGFALVMFVAGSHVPVHDPQLRAGLRIGTVRAVAVGVIAAVLGVVIANIFDTGHAALYAVLMASSSAALILPIVSSLRLGGVPVLQMLPQVALADTACIVVLPLVIDPEHALRAALGTVAVLGATGALFLLLRWLERTGIRKHAHQVSDERKFALELRMNLAVLFGLAALAVWAEVSIMLAGFAFGVAVALVGEPRRLARQLFAVTEGFLGPLFFVWLGATLDLGELVRNPAFAALGLALGIGAVLAHVAMRLLAQPLSMGAMASAQLGVPIAAATVGADLHVLAPGEPAALILGALVTIAVTAVAGSLAARGGLVAEAGRAHREGS